MIPKGLLEIFCLECNFEADSERVEQLEEMVSKECKERAGRFYKMEDRLRCIYGEVMARQILGKYLEKNSSEIVFKRNSYGKPKVQGEAIFYNISHSGDYVLCAVSDQPVGVDIEKQKEMDLGIAENFFTKEEYLWLLSQENETDAFFRLWTLKESYVKWCGMGLSIPLNSFYTKILQGKALFYSQGQCKAYGKEYSLNGYRIALCSEFNSFPSYIKIKHYI